MFNVDASARVLLRTLSQKLLPAIHPDRLATVLGGQHNDTANRGQEHKDSLEAKWGEVLNHYTSAAKQIDQLWNDVLPEYSITAVVPQAPRPTAVRNPSFPQHGQGEQLSASDLNSRRLAALPALLSTLIPADDAPHCVHNPDPSFHLKNIDTEKNNSTDCSRVATASVSSSGISSGISSNDSAGRKAAENAGSEFSITEEELAAAIEEHNSSISEIIDSVVTARMDQWKDTRHSSSSSSISSSSSGSSVNSSSNNSVNTAGRDSIGEHIVAATATTATGITAGDRKRKFDLT